MAEHRQAIEAMDLRLAEAGVAIEWNRAVLLDVGGGGGIHSGLLASRCHRVHCGDVIDQHARYNGEFLRLLKEKLARYGAELPLERFEVNTTDAHEMMFRDSYFNVVTSFNALEHIPDPGATLREVARVLRGGGVCYITFDPIWTADTGSHFFHRVPEPWAHLALSADEYARRMRVNGAGDWEVEEFRHAMNRIRLPVYESLFGNARSLGLEVVFETSWSGVAHERHLVHPNYDALQRTYSQRELLFRGMSLILRKLA